MTDNLKRSLILCNERDKFLKKIIFMILAVTVLLLLVVTINEVSAFTMANRRSFTPSATICDSFGGDDDGDAICNNWEPATIASPNQNMVVKITTTDATVYTYICGPGTADPVCPRKDHKDVFVEIDFNTGRSPDTVAIQRVKDAFAAVPNNLFAVTNPDATDGITLHVQNGEAVQNDVATGTRFPGLDTSSLRGFDQIKAVHFGTPEEQGAAGWTTLGWKQKNMVFHYALFTNYQYGNAASSGIGEVFGNDFMVTLGSFSGGIGSTDEQAATFMHELGHNLKLHHGGDWLDTVNCKPNFISIMSHSRQFTSLVGDRKLDYSRLAMGPLPTTNWPGTDASITLNEGTGSLNEFNGVDSYTSVNPTQEHVVYGPTAPVPLPYTGIGIDWNNDNGGTPDDASNSASINLNSLSAIPGCDGSGASLVGHNDWNTLGFRFRDHSNGADGAERTLDSFPSDNISPVKYNEEKNDDTNIVFIALDLPNDEIMKKKPDTMSNITKVIKSDDDQLVITVTGGGSLTKDDLDKQLIFTLTSFGKAINDLPIGSFVEPESQSRNYYVDITSEQVKLIKSDKEGKNYPYVIDLLYKERTTMDGSNGGNPNDDKINLGSREKLYEALNVNIAGVTALADFTPNEDHPKPAIEVTVNIPTGSSVQGCEGTNSCFIMADTWVSPGSTVTWINNDAAAHTVTSGSNATADGKFDSGLINPGKTFTYTFEEEGTYQYFCMVHPWMTGIVTVNLHAVPEFPLVGIIILVAAMSTTLLMRIMPKNRLLK